MKYVLGDTYANDDTVNVLPVGAVALTDTEWNNRRPAIPKTLPEVKPTKHASLEASRDAAITTLAPVTVAGKQYPATPGYREIVSNLARRSAAGKPIPATLRGADGTPVTLTAALLGLIDDALASAVNDQYDKWGTKFDAVQAATTVEAVNAVAW